MAGKNKSDIKFGTDGWRGVIAREVTLDNVGIVAQCIADYINTLNKTKADNRCRTEASVIIGYDNRFLSEMFARRAAGVMAANGITVQVSDSSVTSPAISFFAKSRNVYGIMITASHNPPDWNGIKIKLQYGGSVSERVITEIAGFLGRTRVKYKDTVIKTADVAVQYEQFLRTQIKVKPSPALKIVVDPMHGSGIGFLENIISKGVHAIHNYRDPLFSGVNPEPIECNLKLLKKEVLRLKAAAGFAFDGDADRLGVVDDRGRYLSPHIVFPLILLYLLEYKKLSGKVVQSVSLGYLSERIARHFRLPFETVNVGFKYICAKMLDEDVLIGGEESGGYGFKGALPERDGILNALLVCEMLAVTGKSLSQLVADLQRRFGKSRYIRRDIALEMTVDKKLFVKYIERRVKSLKNLKELQTFDGIKLIFSDDSWLLMRPSGTEPVLRTYSETPSLKKTEELLDFAHTLAADYIRQHS